MLLVGIIVIAMLATGMFSFLGSLQNEYGFNTTQNYSIVSSTLNASTIPDTFNESITKGDNATTGFFGTLSQFLGFEDTALVNFMPVVNTFKLAWNIGEDATTATGDLLHLPDWVIPSIIAMITIAIVLFIAGMALRRNL